MLKIDPNLRPTAQDLLRNPSISVDKKEICSQTTKEVQSLLDTIVLPKNLNVIFWSILSDFWAVFEVYFAEIELSEKVDYEKE